MWRDRCLKTFLLTFVLLIIIGFFRNRILSPLPQNTLSEKVFWTLKTFAHSDFDMILVGDSRLYRGVSPDAMNTVLPNYRILNFGYSGSGLTPTMYREAMSKLDPESSQKTIVLGVTPLSLLSRPKSAENLHFQETKNVSAEYVYLVQNFPSLVNFFRPLKIEEIMPPELEKKLRKLFKQEYSGYIYHIFHDNGWVASWLVPENPKLSLKFYRNVFSTHTISTQLVQDLIKQVRIWDQQGIHVFGFRTPSSKEMEAVENELSGFDERSFCKQFEAVGGVWFSFPVENYHSYDGSHLHKDSAIQLSIDLATRIKEYLASSP